MNFIPEGLKAWQDLNKNEVTVMTECVAPTNSPTVKTTRSFWNRIFMSHLLFCFYVNTDILISGKSCISRTQVPSRKAKTQAPSHKAKTRAPSRKARTMPPTTVLFFPSTFVTTRLRNFLSYYIFFSVFNEIFAPHDDFDHEKFFIENIQNIVTQKISSPRAHSYVGRYDQN